MGRFGLFAYRGLGCHDKYRCCFELRFGDCALYDGVSEWWWFSLCWMIGT